MTTAQAAKFLGLSVQRIRVLAAEGRLGGIKIGRDWLFSRKALAKFKRER